VWRDVGLGLLCPCVLAPRRTRSNCAAPHASFPDVINAARLAFLPRLLPLFGRDAAPLFVLAMDSDLPLALDSESPLAVASLSLDSMVIAPESVAPDLLVELQDSIVVAAERPAKTRKTWRGKTSSERAARRPARVQRNAKKRSAPSTEKRKKNTCQALACTSRTVPYKHMQNKNKQKIRHGRGSNLHRDGPRAHHAGLANPPLVCFSYETYHNCI